MIRLKRAYEPPARSDGYRVLVERLWPRGLRKADANNAVVLARELERRIARSRRKPGHRARAVHSA